MDIGNESEEVQRQYLEIAANYSYPIFWTDSNGILGNGTAFVLDTGTKRFVVTAAHVYEDYIAAKSNDDTIKCWLSEIEFQLENRRISNINSTSMDIGTFSISDDEVASLQKGVLRGSQQDWPPAIPDENEAVVIAGFPGIERIESGSRECSFGLHCFNTPVSSKSERHFGCSFEREYWVDVFGKGLPEELYNLGGISGAPAIALEKSDNDIISWRLAGVVYEANASELLGEILFAHHAKHINSDGTVREFQE